MIINPQQIFKERLLNEMNKEKNAKLNELIDKFFTSQTSRMLGRFNFSSPEVRKLYKYMKSLGIRIFPNTDPMENTKVFDMLGSLAKRIYKEAFDGSLRPYVKIITEFNYFEYSQPERAVLHDSGLVLFTDFYPLDGVAEDILIYLDANEEVAEILNNIYEEINEKYGFGYKTSEEDIEL